MTVFRVRRSRGDLHAEMVVAARIPGVKGINRLGVLHRTNINLHAGTTRKNLAKLLEERTPGIAFDWFHVLEKIAFFIMNAEAEGQPVVELGKDYTSGSRGYAVDPLLPLGTATLLYAPGGTGKSITAMAVAISVVTGVEVVPGIKPVSCGPVLYLDWETDPGVVNSRIHAIAAGVREDAPKIHYRRCNRPLADDAEELSILVAKEGIVMVVVDSAAMAMGAQGEYGDANESTLKFFDAIRQIGVTTLVVDHVSKQEMRAGGKTVGRLPYGSVYKVNLARCAWEMRQAELPTDDVRAVDITLFNTKANDARLHDPMDLRIIWDQGVVTFTERDTPPVSHQPVGNVRPAAETVVWEFVEDMQGPFRAAVVKSTFKDYPENLIDKALGRLVDKGKLRRTGYGTYQVVTSGQTMNL